MGHATEYVGLGLALATIRLSGNSLSLGRTMSPEVFTHDVPRVDAVQAGTCGHSLAMGRASPLLSRPSGWELLQTMFGVGVNRVLLFLSHWNRLQLIA